MAQKSTIYANVVNLTLTPLEFVIEFGAHFPTQPNQPPPSDFSFDTRVVMPAAALDGLVAALQKAAAQRRPARAAVPVAPKQTPGFQSTPPSKEGETS